MDLCDCRSQYLGSYGWHAPPCDLLGASRMGLGTSTGVGIHLRGFLPHTPTRPGVVVQGRPGLRLFSHPGDHFPAVTNIQACVPVSCEAQTVTAACCGRSDPSQVPPGEMRGPVARKLWVLLTEMLSSWDSIISLRPLGREN